MCVQRIKALRRVRTYVLEAEDEDGSNIATVTVHDPVSEIVSVYRDMLTRRVRLASTRYPTQRSTPRPLR